MWAKIPAATASIACAACIAAASVAIPAVQSSEGLAKTISSEVNLSAINFTPLLGLGSLDGIPAWLNFLATGNVDSFTTNDDQPGYAALNGLEAWSNVLSGDTDALGDIDAFSAVPGLLEGDITALDAFGAIPIYEKIASGTATVSDLNDLESVNAAYSFNEFAQTGSLQAFEPVEDVEGNVVNPGYAALSGAYAWQEFAESGGDVTKLSKIDAFSAIPNWQKFLESGDVTKDGLGGIDAFSALPALSEVAESATTTADEPETLSARASSESTESTSTSTQTSNPGTQLKQLSQTITQSLPQANVQAPAAPAAEEPKASTSTSSTKTKQAAEEPTGTSKVGGSYSGSFKPEPIVLFGSGKGNGADNGIRGWGEGLKKLGIGGGDTESAGGESGGEGAE